MKWTGLNELREMFLQFFESKQHLRLPSFPLVPNGDKSLLLINSGMAPMKKWFLGTEEPPSHRVTTCQKCIRTPDIESVGITDRHGTFFEMLGNFSFQNYFKAEAVAWAWEFFTSPEWLEIPPSLLQISVYEEDDETYDLWTKTIGVAEENMVRLGKADNFWEHGSGPCGPCSEIYFDRGPKHGCGSPDCKAGCECDRFIEVWNLVFTEFDSDGNGNYEKLAKPNIDTGMGLERLACIMQDAPNLFETDTVRSILEHVEKLSGKAYRTNKQTDISIRVITDHIRSTVFMVSDGIIPSNEGRGYVLRRLLRRAARHGRMLGIESPFLEGLCDTVIAQNRTAYPELEENANYIKKIIVAEEERFARTIDAGLTRLADLIEQIKNGERPGAELILSGAEAFRLNDTFGFPLDLTREIAQEHGIMVDIETFKQELAKQRAAAREDRKKRDIAGWETDAFASETIPATEFTGYTKLVDECKVLALACDGELVEAVAVDDAAKENILVVLNKTPFYAESGGQVADTGMLSAGGAQLKVLGVHKNAGGLFVHNCTLLQGTLKTGDTLLAEVNADVRHAIMRNHTAAHLLQKALREILGEHVHQSGSYVDDEHVRFDFTHFSALTTEEIRLVEDLVNRVIFQALPVQVQTMPIAEAKKLGALALFGEKYGEEVRVVDVEGFSTEFCGGTHVSNTSMLGSFKIITETSVAAGVRRIEGTTGYGVLRMLDERENLIRMMAATARVANVTELPNRIAAVMEEMKRMDRELSSMKDAAAGAQADDLFKSPVEVDGVKVFTARLADTDPEALRKMCDLIRTNAPDGVGALVGEAEGKITLAVCCGAQAVARGLAAGKLAKEIAAVAGGSGGGKPDFAMAGIKDASKVQAALDAVAGIVQNMLQ